MSDEYYVPGTEETDLKKIIMSLQQLAAVVSAGGSGAASNTGYFAVNRGASGSGSGTAATFVPMAFTTEVVDSEGWFDNVTTYRYTPLEAGKYYIGVSGSANGNTGGPTETCQAAIAKNGSVVLSGQYFVSSIKIVSSVYGIVDMNGTTDYIEGQIYLPTGVTAYAGGTTVCFMFGWKIGA